MSDRLHPIGAARLAAWIAGEMDGSDSIFGVPGQLWFRPSPDHRYGLELRGKTLETPVGVAAGPHTQLAQNIVIAWLCGARVMELKTVQTLDRIDVAKPCIDMQDGGYNIEWSQELTIRESFREYLTAWILIHVLHDHLGFPDKGPGVLFDLSVGYDLEGIKQPNMRWFLEHAADAGDEFERCVAEIAESFPMVRDLEIPRRLADSVTVSTLHGCPPNEIGAIVEHLLDHWRLHTAVKLNPTLLGYSTVREILVDDLGWVDVEPDRQAFDADIGYTAALTLVDELNRHGEVCGREFSIKLCNTLPVINRRSEFDSEIATAYLSGRPLHALAVELARRLTEATDGKLSISFAGGADALNTPSLLAAGLRPITTCSDLLRPGGYLRLGQYLEEIDVALDEVKAMNLDDLCLRRAKSESSLAAAALGNLNRYADSLRIDPELARAAYRRDHTKTHQELGFFDCVEAPCTAACSVGQRVPAYMRKVASGDLAGAADVIAMDNPLPSILGRACHHPCEPVCLRTHLDRPVAIREIKRFVTDHASASLPRVSPGPDAPRVAIIGAGPCGLATAADLARAGVQTVLFEARNEGGGMVSATIPGYRAAASAVRRDLAAIAALGVTTEFGVAVGSDRTLEDFFSEGYDSIVVAVGAQRGLELGLEDEDADGVMDGLDFLRRARRGIPTGLGGRVAVVGGGDVAMDCARSARRLGNGRVEIIYRRTKDQMPAHPEEIRDLLAEGIGIRELVNPRRIVVTNGRLHTLECAQMQLGETDHSGRPRPVEVAGAGITLEIDTLIVAIGQRADLGVFGDTPVECSPSGYLEVKPDTLETSIPRIYAGGDLRDPGPANIVDACGDGQRIARAILKREGLSTPVIGPIEPLEIDLPDLLARRSHRQDRVPTPRISGPDHADFDEVVRTIDSEAATTEAARCLDCDVYCSTCEGVCPNRAILTYRNESPTHEATQIPQIAVMADLCNECGNCATFCPTMGRPWRDKPRIYFHRGDFEAEQDNAFMLLRINDRPGIQGRFGGETRQLVVDVDFFNPEIESAMSTSIMYTILRGLTRSEPHLPLPEANPRWLVQEQDG